MDRSAHSHREIAVSADGSATLWVPGLDEHYHSIHGALTESLHVFIEHGLRFAVEQMKGQGPVAILEVGLGTALNARLSFEFAREQGASLAYEALEKYPITPEEAAQLAQVGMEAERVFLSAPHNETIDLDGGTFALRVNDLRAFEPEPSGYDLVYFDAFAPSAQPELWTLPIFEKMFAALRPGGTLVTYCAKGDVKRAMKAAGFVVEALPGPPRKREMTRARKPTL